MDRIGEPVEDVPKPRVSQGEFRHETRFSFPRLWPVLALIALVLASYAGRGPSELVLDDLLAIGHSPVVSGKLPLTAAFTHDFWGYTAQHTVGTYRPVAVLSLALDTRIGGFTPSTWRLSSILWHLLAVLAVYGVWRRLTSEQIGWTAAAVLAVAAAPSEAVLSGVGRADVLCALWSTLGLWAHRRPGWRGVAGAGLCFALALGSKETGIVAPVAWLAMDALFPLDQRSWRVLLARAAAALPVVPLYLWGRVVATGAIASSAMITELHNPLLGADRLHRLFGASRIFLVRYLAGIVDPWRRIYDCSASACGPSGPSDPLAWLGLALVVLLIASPFLLRRRSPVAAAGLAWCALYFLPPSNLIVVGPSAYGERLLYTPFIGLGLALGAALVALARRWRRPAFLGAGLAALLALNVWAVRERRGAWDNREALNASQLPYAPNSTLLQHDIAMRANLRRDFPAAERAARLAIEAFPSNYQAHGELAAALFAQGRLDEAGLEFDRAYTLGRDSTLVVDYANYLGRRGEYRKGLAVVEDFLKDHASNQELADVRARLERRLARAP